MFFKKWKNQLKKKCCDYLISCGFTDERPQEFKVKAGDHQVEVSNNFSKSDTGVEDLYRDYASLLFLLDKYVSVHRK